MVNFISGEIGTQPSAERWGSYFGNVDDRRHRRWLQGEAVAERERAHLRARDEAESYRQFAAEHAGLFQNADQDFANLRRTLEDPITANPPVVGVDVDTGTAAGTIAGSSRQPTVELGQPSNTPEYNATSRTGPVGLGSLNNRERAAVEAYVAAAGGRPAMFGGGFLGLAPGRRPRPVDPAALAAANEQLRALGLEMRNGQLYRSHRTYTDEALRFPMPAEVSDPNAPGSAATAGSAPPVELWDGAEGSEVSPSPAEPADAPRAGLDNYEQGWQDTSRGLRPTREMQMLETAMQNSLRRAELAARHGAPEEAEQHFAQALQGLAAYTQHQRMVLYRNAAAGSRDALNSLIEQFYGVPPGDVRVRNTDERRPRFMIEIRNNENEWVPALEAPVSRDQMLSGLLNLVDQTGAAERAESQTALAEAQIRAGADITVARIGALNAQLRARVDLVIAQLGTAERMAIASQGRMYTNNETGESFIIYPGSDGHPRMLNITREEQRVADTRGRRTEERTVVRPLTRQTGVVGVGAE